MSVEDYPDSSEDEAGSEPVRGTDFETDLRHVGRVAVQAIGHGQERNDQFHQSVFSRTDELFDWFDRNDVSPEEAVATAWFFILHFDPE